MAGKRKLSGTATKPEAKKPRIDLDSTSSLLHEPSDLSDPEYFLNEVDGDDGENVEEEYEGEFTDGEQEDEVVDAGNPVDVDYDKLHRDFMKKWSLKGQGIDMSFGERFGNLSRFRARLTHVLRTWIDAARSVQFEQFATVSSRENLPFVQGVWSIFNKLEVDSTIDQILKDTPEVVQVVLGRPGPMTLDIIDELPCNWEQNLLWGVYADLTKHVEEDFFDPYVGSATGRHGLHGRCSLYKRTNEMESTTPSQTGRHERHIGQPDVKANVRVLWINNPNEKTSGYTSVVEQVWSSFFGCHRSPSRNPRATIQAIAVGAAALPADFQSMPHRGLNDAFQSLQTAIWKRQHKYKCSDLNCQVEKSRGGWHAASRLVPLGPRLCKNCASYRDRNNGESRPRELIESFNARVAHPLPADKKCENCSVPEDLLAPGRCGFFYFLQKWTKWVCFTCYTYASNHDGKLRPESLYKKLIPKSTKGPKPDCCPKCKTKGRRWNWDKDLDIWLCNVCYMQNHRRKTNK